MKFHFQYGNYRIAGRRQGRIFHWSPRAVLSSLQNPRLSQSPRNDSKLLRFYELTDILDVIFVPQPVRLHLTAIPLRRKAVGPIEAVRPRFLSVIKRDNDVSGPFSHSVSAGEMTQRTIGLAIFGGEN
jgi:hypothetical protein